MIERLIDLKNNEINFNQVRKFNLKDLQVLLKELQILTQLSESNQEERVSDLDPLSIDSLWAEVNVELAEKVKNPNQDGLCGQELACDYFWVTRNNVVDMPVLMNRVAAIMASHNDSTSYFMPKDKRSGWNTAEYYEFPPLPFKVPEDYFVNELLYSDPDVMRHFLNQENDIQEEGLLVHCDDMKVFINNLDWLMEFFVPELDDYARREGKFAQLLIDSAYYKANYRVIFKDQDELTDTLEEVGRVNESTQIDWKQFPLGEMLKRKWVDFNGSLSTAKKNAEKILSSWASPVRGDLAFEGSFLRQHKDSRGKSHALNAWFIRVSLLALEQNLPEKKKPVIDDNFIQQLVRLSVQETGPLLAKEFLLNNGIHFVIEPHLPKTRLDGAAFRLVNGSPVIALTLRYDRIDYFWFTLLHELAHHVLHLQEDRKMVFIDEFDYTTDCSECIKEEDEANSLATNALISSDAWIKSGLTQKYTSEKVKSFAKELGIHPAIPAGRIRKEKNNYRILSKLVGSGRVRNLFSD